MLNRMTTPNQIHRVVRVIKITNVTQRAPMPLPATRIHIVLTQRHSPERGKAGTPHFVHEDPGATSRIKHEGSIRQTE